jgi:hypothetical protein
MAYLWEDLEREEETCLALWRAHVLEYSRPCSIDIKVDVRVFSLSLDQRIE